MGVQEDILLGQIAQAVGKAGLKQAASKIDSSTLRAALELIVSKTGDQGVEARLFIPHYWAVYYHDGRRGFGTVDNVWLVYFTDPKDDPRIQGGYPVRGNDIQTLTRGQYEFGLRKNRERRASGGVPYMIVTKSVGPAGAHPFFTKGMVGFKRSADRVAKPYFDAYIQRIVDEDGPDKGTATFSL